jgi:hypothetical protein
MYCELCMGAFLGTFYGVRGRDLDIKYLTEQLHRKIKESSDNDVLDESETSSNEATSKFTDYSFGLAVKSHRSLFLLWKDKVENYPIGQLNLSNLLHFRSTNLAYPTSFSLDTPENIGNNFIILSHGFSPDLGPDYALIHILTAWFKGMGYQVIGIVVFNLFISIIYTHSLSLFYIYSIFIIQLILYI